MFFFEMTIQNIRVWGCFLYPFFCHNVSLSVCFMERFHFKFGVFFYPPDWDVLGRAKRPNGLRRDESTKNDAVFWLRRLRGPPGKRRHRRLKSSSRSIRFCFVFQRNGQVHRVETEATARRVRPDPQVRTGCRESKASKESSGRRECPDRRAASELRGLPDYQEFQVLLSFLFDRTGRLETIISIFYFLFFGKFRSRWSRWQRRARRSRGQERERWSRRTIWSSR